jgi:tRNA G18 (ribose-2'-O)-methylase SpoU
VSVIRVEDLTDRRLSAYAAVSDPAQAHRAGFFIAEGRAVVERLLRSRQYPVRSLLLSEASLAALTPELTELSSSIPVFIAGPRHFEELTGFNLHRGCLAIADRPPAASPNSLVPSAKLIVMLESVSDPDNVGSIFRNAAAFMVDAVLLNPTSCDPLYRKAIRTSMGATLLVPFARYDSWASVCELLRGHGFTIVSLSPRAKLCLNDFVERPTPLERIALVLGPEGTGLSDDVRESSDVDVRIPVSLQVDSLNVSVASGIALFRLARR